MDNILNKNGLANIAKDMFAAYLKKSEGQSASNWLFQELGKQLPEMDDGRIAELQDAIDRGIEDFNSNLQSVETAAENGVNHQQWLREKLASVDTADVELARDMIALGNQGINSALNAGRLRIDQQAVMTIEDSERSEKGYDGFLASQAISELGQQADIAGAGAMALAGCDENEGLPMVLEPVSDPYLDSITGSEEDIEVKKIASAALAIGARRGTIPFMTEETPIPLITNIACWGIEGAKTAKRLFDGNLNADEAVDRMARVTCSAVADTVLKGISKLAVFIPVVGPVISTTLAPVLSTVGASTAGRVIYEGLKRMKPVATAIVRGAVETVKSVVSGVKNLVSSIFSWF